MSVERSHPLLAERLRHHPDVRPQLEEVPKTVVSWVFLNCTVWASLLLGFFFFATAASSLVSCKTCWDWSKPVLNCFYKSHSQLSFLFLLLSITIDVMFAFPDLLFDCQARKIFIPHPLTRPGSMQLLGRCPILHLQFGHKSKTQ